MNVLENFFFFFLGGGGDWNCLDTENIRYFTSLNQNMHFNGIVRSIPVIVADSGPFRCVPVYSIKVNSVKCRTQTTFYTPVKSVRIENKVKVRSCNFKQNFGNYIQIFVFETIMI